ncbi:DNA-binding transcriptional LysR family regulator [Amycolatopsis lexingtonensis]|uniref:DNA-binding transcriptional LysR family regulator n=1 Tax=Amycolatopsis lexingtonensis TaxID=218822 RepID=A0ABR9HY14_9PSEU|nr:LysR family transcriptional regulator [Amycolatopsis lexingtonensis]MBE1495826.1 DNA-binding transcriptional LysR family regulator [Amycolatopsis lexingtonensis]
MAEVTLTGLRVIREVAATGSFTAAAASLGYTQSAISRQIAMMEAAAGTALFERHARGVRPSPAGALLARHATTALAVVDTAEQELAGLRDRLAGRLSIGAFPAAAAVLVPRALAVLRTRHPGLAVTLEEGATPALLSRLRAGRTEVVVIGVGDGLPGYDLGGLQQDVLTEDDLRVAVPAGHRLAHRPRVAVADLRDETWIVGRGGRGEPQFGAWPTLEDPRVGHAVRSWTTRLGMVAAGLGIALLPGVAAASVPAGVVVVSVEDPSWRGRAAVAVTRQGRSAGATAMVDALREQAAADRG